MMGWLGEYGWVVLGWMGKALWMYASLTFVVPLAGVYQERRIWASTPNPLSVWGHVRVYGFNVIWMQSTLFGSLLIAPKLLWQKNVEVESHCWVESLSARLCMGMFVGPVVVRGTDHLPPSSSTTNTNTPAPVYIANHASQADAGAVYFLARRFKWIAKKSVLYLPGVGQTMFLSGHVMINRRTGKNTKSVSSLYTKSNDAIQSGIPMFIFPQGTRRLSTRLPFKDGAFNIAITNHSDIIPISIEIPPNLWNNPYPIPKLWGGTQPDPIILTVHPPISTRNKTMNDKEALKQHCSDLIYSFLPPHMQPITTTSSSSSSETKKTS
uniref:Phospholipid/glycerol acyltransferase domain-containing protein n=1 Tax=Attheya septentrionalis TaxID=420275 RepID=A0A7S2UC78_9STRA|mmetsp:Transcript_17332/g.31293  ORF Transcript_17332/g.31293 Transcript_17332/m.31293 type:complete len:324 (+) Transcript_17332:217-1188(+)